MRTADLDYALPVERIAQHPLPERDGARLLVVSPEGLMHQSVRDWPHLVPPGALVVINDSRVIRARLRGHRAGTGGRVEVLLLGPSRDESVEVATVWSALGRSNRPLRPGAVVEVGGLRVDVLERGADGTLTVELHSDEPVAEAIAREGSVPIPPYVRRPEEEADRDRY
ncbi:MAG: S-adenosylmethionine:tRNA ribosyltransferase-isomerase, partial [Polyangiaceae bacterium]|nr:S-adenosylmethionine:tRNA ribosyltransferase-isomerase [Polyangiaceae bacterium]